MKKRKHKLLDSALLLLFLLALGGLGFGLYFYFGQAPEGAVEAAALEDADAVLYLHVRDMDNSAFMRAIEEEDEVPPQMKEFLDSLGVRQEDIVEGLVAVGNLSAIQQNRLQDAGISGALRLASRLTLDRIEAVLDDTLDEDQRGNMRRTGIGDRSVLEFPLPDLEISLAAAVFDREDDGTTLYFGDMNSLRDTLAKLNSRRETVLPGSVREGRDALAPETQGWLVAALSTQMQNELRNALQASPVPLGPVGDALGSLERVGLGMRANQALNTRLALAFGSPEDARAVRDMFNENIAPMLRMAAQSELDTAPAFLDGLRAQATENTVSLAFSLSIEEARRLGEAAAGEVDEVTPDPDPEPEGEPEAVEETEVPPWPSLHVETVIPSIREAVINGELIPEGEEIEGVTLHEVEADGVILRREQEYRFVAVGDRIEPED